MPNNPIQVAVKENGTSRAMQWLSTHQLPTVLLIFMGGALLLSGFWLMSPRSSLLRELTPNTHVIAATTATATRAATGAAKSVAPQRSVSTTVATATPVKVKPAVASANNPPIATSAADVAAASPPPTATATTEPIWPFTTTQNILIMGSDQRLDTTNWRTDVIMIVALDFANHQAGIVSIPRDVYIDQVPDHQPNRINVIDYLGEQDDPGGGGPALLAAIIRERMKIRIDHYLRFDFQSFQQVVDSLGGVTIQIDCPHYNYAETGDLVLKTETGTTRMNGKEALRYVRDRRMGGDLDRARRQQRFVWAVRNQIRDENMIAHIPDLYRALYGSVQTDIGIVSAIRIVRFALGLEEADVHGLVLAPPTLLKSGWRSGMSVFLADWPTIEAALQTIFESRAFVETNTPSRCPS